MSCDWTVARLGSLTEIGYGFTESASWERVGPKFLRITDIQPDGVDWEAVPYCSVTGSDLDKFRLANDDIVFARTGATTGKSYLVQSPPESVFASYLIRMRLRSQVLLPRFLHLFFQTAEYWKAIEAGSSGSAQGGFNASKLGALQIKFPAIGEQERIVAILDEAFEGIATAKANAEKNLQNARELFVHHREVILSPQPGWHEAPLAELCTVKHGYAFEGEFFSASGEHVLLTPGSFYEAGGYRERGEKTKYFVGPIPEDYVLSAGDLLVAMTEQAAGLLGSPLLVPESNRFLHNQRLGLVVGRVGVPWSNAFFFHVFNLLRVRQEIHASASGAKVRHTSPGKIGLVSVAYPDTLDEQLRIASRLVELGEECGRLEEVYQRKISALDELKKSLLHQAFSGKL